MNKYLNIPTHINSMVSMTYWTDLSLQIKQRMKFEFSKTISFGVCMPPINYFDYF